MSHAAPLDRVFRALADPTRRRIVHDLARGDRTVMDLARQFAMSQPAVTKHLNVLESAGLIARHREGRRRRCALRPRALRRPTAWLRRYESLWNQRLDALERLLAEPRTEED
jgi:DNA-binding transcriptional ArsR family regulator